MSECVHNCGCGHADCGHEHHDASAHIAGGISIKLSRHEEAVAATVHFVKTGTPQTVEEEMTAGITALCEVVKSRGGIVGHVKAALTGESEVTTFSSTGGAVTVKRKTEGRYEAELVAIVVGLDGAELEASVSETFGDKA